MIAGRKRKYRGILPRWRKKAVESRATNQCCWEASLCVGSLPPGFWRATTGRDSLVSCLDYWDQKTTKSWRNLKAVEQPTEIEDGKIPPMMATFSRQQLLMVFVFCPLHETGLDDPFQLYKFLIQPARVFALLLNMHQSCPFPLLPTGVVASQTIETAVKLYWSEHLRTKK